MPAPKKPADRLPKKVTPFTFDLAGETVKLDHPGEYADLIPADVMLRIMLDPESQASENLMGVSVLRAALGDVSRFDNARHMLAVVREWFEHYSVAGGDLPQSQGSASS